MIHDRTGYEYEKSFWINLCDPPPSLCENQLTIVMTIFVPLGFDPENY